MLYLNAIMTVLHPHSSSMQSEAVQELVAMKKLPTEKWSTFLTQAHELCTKIRLGKKIDGTKLATTLLFPILDKIQDVNGIRQTALKMHRDHTDGNPVEPWDIISKLLAIIVEDHKHWKKGNPRIRTKFLLPCQRASPTRAIRQQTLAQEPK